MLFFSPSAIKSYLSAGNSAEPVAFCVGNTTAVAAIVEFDKVYVAETPSVEAVTALVVEKFKIKGQFFSLSEKLSKRIIEIAKAKSMNRTRRLRKSEGIRRLVRENQLTIDDFIYPLFVEEGKNIEKEIVSMPGIKRYSLDKIDKELDEVVALNLPAVLLFGIPSEKDEVGSETWNDNGVIQQAIRHIKTKYPSLYVITDVCFCEYTSHGHCGIIHENDVHNDDTLVNIAKQVVSHAKAGVDMVAPSGMMDGTIATIREALDHTGYGDLPIMGYSVKYASAFYGPFRDAADSSPSFGDRNTYQMDPANRDEGMREATF